MTIRKLWYEQVNPHEYDYTSLECSNLERLRIDPPLDSSLIERIRAIEGTGDPDYASIVEVSPTAILMEMQGSCEGLTSKILKVLRQEGDVDTDIPESP